MSLVTRIVTYWLIDHHWIFLSILEGRQACPPTIGYSIRLQLFPHFLCAYLLGEISVPLMRLYGFTLKEKKVGFRRWS
jgi:hypothetical protein